MALVFYIQGFDSTSIFGNALKSRGSVSMIVMVGRGQPGLTHTLIGSVLIRYPASG